MYRDDLVTCGFCLMDYCVNDSNDSLKHEKYHAKCVDSYKRTLAQNAGGNRPVSWFRPSSEDAGMYQALNELNPSLAGFTYFGLTKEEWESIQTGIAPLSVGRGVGDGHDRYGIWIGPDGAGYRYHANWRAGKVHFWLTEPDS